MQTSHYWNFICLISYSEVEKYTLLLKIHYCSNFWGQKAFFIIIEMIKFIQ